ncbi:hypothetical protein [Neisseria sp. CCUG12390]|uniref:hypothetical protein n=1 Tax=Neisseria sp. CCUG12390 TaxID=3392035 RepID=UPI003A100DDA
MHRLALIEWTASENTVWNPAAGRRMSEADRFADNCFCNKDTFLNVNILRCNGCADFAGRWRLNFSDGLTVVKNIFLFQ